MQNQVEIYVRIKSKEKKNTQNRQKAAKKQILISTCGKSAKEKCFNVDLYTVN